MIDAGRWAAVSALFDELVERPPEERERRLAALADHAFADEVRALLAADDEGGMLDAGPSDVLPALLGEPEPQDRSAGAYRLLRKLGEGGMGVVWLAERTDGAFEQRVAIKLLKRGMDSHAILRRFLQERSILARLAHPHIVRLLDGGMSADGRPFYAMEYVDGDAITVWAEHRKLGIEARVALLAKVADAVAWAHAHLVVHRDLKPSNVLVDAAGEPRVLDFGIAKLLEPTGGETVTCTGQRAFSPAYAAPEQLRGEPVGTATDVHALGLLLHELLVGVIPRARGGGDPASIAHAADGAAVERASACLGRQTQAHVQSLYGKGADRVRLARRLRGDLDVIIATALQREPQRRYPTAAAFADDLRRWLDGRVIVARADSAAYRLSKFVRRHRAAVVAALLVLLSLVAGLGATLWQARAAREAAQRADAEREKAEQQLARSDRVKQFILTLFREQDPIARARAAARTPVDLVREGIAEVEASFGAQAELQAELLRDLGEIQVGVDEPVRATETLRRAWQMQERLTGPQSTASADAFAAYAESVHAAGDIAAATPLLREAAGRLRAAGLDRHPRAAQVAGALALVELVAARNEEAERLARDALAIDRAAFGEGSVQVATRLATLANVLQETGRYDEALDRYREALAIVVATGGEDHVRGAMLNTRIGDVLRVQRRYQDALPAYEAAVRIERLQLPAGHRLLGSTLIRLGDLQRRMRRFDDADRSLAQAIGILQASGAVAQYAQALQFHGVLARAKGQPDLAAARLRASFEAFRESTGDSVYTWLTALLRVESLLDSGLLGEAEAVVDAAVAARGRMAKDEYLDLYMANVAGMLRHAQGRIGEAIGHRRRALEGLLAMYGPDHAEVAQARIALAASLVAAGGDAERDEAGRFIEEARATLAGKDDPDAAAMLGSALLERSRIHLAHGDVDGARADLRDALARLQLRPEDARRLHEARRFERLLASR